MHKKSHGEILASVIIPAFNEAGTVGHVVRTASLHPLVGEVIVVDDCSLDDTARYAREAGADVISLQKNCGKGSALDRGVASARYDTIIFLDADLRGLTPAMLTKLITPVLTRETDMSVGLHDRRYYWLNALFRYIPMLAGQRALTKSLWHHIPLRYKKNFQTEIALNYFAKRNGEKVSYMLLRGLTHTVKEKKHGWAEGSLERLGMLRDLASISARLYIGESLSSFLEKLKVATVDPRDK